MMVWIRAYVTNNTCLASQGTHYLHGWKARGESERVSKQCTPPVFLVFEQYTATAQLVRGSKAIKSERGDIHKDISKHAR